MRIKSNWNYLPTPIKEKFTANLGKDLPEVRLSIEELNRSTIKLTPFTFPEEVWKIIKNVPSTKVPGCDNIPNSALPDPTVVRLNNIFNTYLRHSHFLKPWKTATSLLFKNPTKITVYQITTGQYHYTYHNFQSILESASKPSQEIHQAKIRTTRIQIRTFYDNSTC